MSAGSVTPRMIDTSIILTNFTKSTESSINDAATMSDVRPNHNGARVYKESVEIRITVTMDAAASNIMICRAGLGMGRDGMIKEIRGVKPSDIVKGRVVFDKVDFHRNHPSEFELTVLEDVRPNSFVLAYPKVPVDKIAEKLHELLRDLNRVFNKLGRNGNTGAREVYLSPPLAPRGIVGLVDISVLYTATALRVSGVENVIEEVSQGKSRHDYLCVVNLKL